MGDEANLDYKQAHVIAQWKHERPLVSCRFEPAGRFVFCGAEDDGVHRFDLVDGARTSFVGGHDTWVRALAFSPDGAVTISGGSDGRLVWWETAASEPKPMHVVDAHKGWIRSLSVSPDGQLLASGGNDNTVRLWDIQQGKLVGELLGHERHVYCVAFHPQAPILLSGDLVGTLRQWDVAERKEVRSFDAKALHSYNDGQRVDFGGVRAIDVSPDLARVAAGGLHKASNPLGAVHEPLVQLFSWDSGQLLRSQIAEGITGGVLWRLRHLGDGTLMGVSGGSSGGFLIFWKADQEKDDHRFQLPNLARDMDLHSDGIRVATAHFDRHVRITRLAAKAG